MKLLDVYPLFEVTPVKARGCRVMDDKGNTYLDFYGGHAVISIGHSHPTFVEAIQDQASKLVFYSNSIINPIQKEVAEKLIQYSGISDYFRLFMINSGAEANENAIKLASFANRRNKFVILEKGWHGRTAGALGLTTGMKHKTAFSLDYEVIKVPMNDLEALEDALKNEDVCAVLAETIQGIGGIYVCSNDYLQGLRSLTKKYGTLWIADEIQCGYGRSGSFFAFQDAGVEPDIITMAKGMGNGFPVGGVLIDHRLLDVEFGMAGTTFGGNHLASRAALAVLEVLQNENMIANAAKQGTYLMDQLKDIPGVAEVRGRGLMIGIQMDFPVSELRKNLLYKERIFTGSSSDPNTIRLLPPLSISQKNCDELIDAFKKEAAIALSLDLQ